jgi:serine/threonine protein kinase
VRPAYTRDVVQSSGAKLVAGKYELVRLLAEGGMGAVYEGRNTATLKRCAIKLLTVPGIDQHPDVVQRFFLEARASSVLESDHIVQTFDSGIDNESGRPYIIMEFLRGEDLKTTLARTGPLEPRAAAKLALQAATGLAKAHEAGILHRDIKPANLFLSRRDSGHVCVKILDFGIAKVRPDDPLAAQGLTQTGSLLGTPLYMSPEQVRGASSVDSATDVWSLGVVLFECLSGDTPFQDRSSIGELMSSILNAFPRHLQDVAPWVPPELTAIVQRSLRRDRAERYFHAGQLRDAIGQLLLGDTELREIEIVGVSASDRTHVSPRLVVIQPNLQSVPRTPRGPVGADAVEIRRLTPNPSPDVTATVSATSVPPISIRQADQTQLSGSSPVEHATNPSLSAADRSRMRRALGVAVGLLTVVLGLVFAARPNQFPSAPSSRASALPPPAVAAAGANVAIVPVASSVSVAPVERPLRFGLRVPKNCKAELDGAPVEVQNGLIWLEGPADSHHVVKLSGCRARHEDNAVTIQTTGLSPAELEAAPSRIGALQGIPPASLAATLDDHFQPPPKTLASGTGGATHGITADTGEFGHAGKH